MKILVDTSILIDFLRCQDKTQSVFWQTFSSGKNQAVLALITVTEIWAGQSTAQKQTADFVNQVIESCAVLLPDIKTAQKAGELLRETSYKISIQDALIAACGLIHNLPVLTLNQKDFKKVPRLKLFEEPSRANQL